jgi:hypothetical protein
MAFYKSDQSALYSVTQTFPGRSLPSDLITTNLHSGFDLRVHAFAPCPRVSAASALPREVPDADTSLAARKETHDQAYLRHGSRTHWSQQAA